MYLYQASYATKKNSWDRRKALYEKTLVAINRLHTYPQRGVLSHHLEFMGPFDEELYKWEHQYFIEHFVEGICRIRLKGNLKKELDNELSKLIEGILSTESALIHRDLQSQNVMIKNGEPFFIDFQGLRFGSIFYDIGSLLFDPYVCFSQDEFNALLMFSYELWKDRFEMERFITHFYKASCQRLMQALGAYGYLGLKKGLKDFLKHIPQAIENLVKALSSVNDLSKLYEVIIDCSETIGFNQHRANIDLR